MASTSALISFLIVAATSLPSIRVADPVAAACAATRDLGAGAGRASSAARGCICAEGVRSCICFEVIIVPGLLRPQGEREGRCAQARAS